MKRKSILDVWRHGKGWHLQLEPAELMSGGTETTYFLAEQREVTQANLGGETKRQSDDALPSSRLRRAW